jgi:iron-sulfur cluster assembly accessory protein
MLTVTEAAQQKVKSVMESQGRPDDGLRLSIVGRRMSSFQYSLGLVELEQASADDVVVDVGAFKIYVDANSAPNLEGVTIDYVEDIQGSGFKIDNPNPLWTDPQHLAVQELFDARINPISPPMVGTWSFSTSRTTRSMCASVAAARVAAWSM